MPHRRLLASLSAAAVLLTAVLAAAPARGDGPADEARAAMAKAVERGQEIYNQRWATGSKPCAECHGPGPNRLRGARLKTYPKWDKTAGKVISGQQKLNQMIQQMGKGEALALGSDDLNALDAYVSSIR